MLECLARLGYLPSEPQRAPADIIIPQVAIPHIIQVVEYQLRGQNFRAAYLVANLAQQSCDSAGCAAPFTLCRHNRDIHSVLHKKKYFMTEMRYNGSGQSWLDCTEDCIVTKKWEKDWKARSLAYQRRTTGEMWP